MSDERRIFLGVIEIESGEALAVDIGADTTAAEIRDAIARANRERAEKQVQESKTLREIFLDKVAIERGDK